MAYIEELTEDSVPLLRRSFVGAATAEILDPKREGEPVDFKQNYPHYNFSDDTSKNGSTRFDSCFKNHGAEDVRESDRGLAVTCMSCRPVRVIAVPKQKIQVEVPAPVALKPRPYVPATTVIEEVVHPEAPATNTKTTTKKPKTPKALESETVDTLERDK